MTPKITSESASHSLKTKVEHKHTHTHTHTHTPQDAALSRKLTAALEEVSSGVNCHSV